MLGTMVKNGVQWILPYAHLYYSLGDPVPSGPNECCILLLLLSWQSAKKCTCKAAMLPVPAAVPIGGRAHAAGMRGVRLCRWGSGRAGDWRGAERGCLETRA